MTLVEMTRPTPLPVRIEGIPQELQAERRWVGWNYVWRDGKWTKPPSIATAPEQPADSTDPATWRSFNEALSAYEDGKCDGIGFVLGDQYVGFDADDTERGGLRGTPEHLYGTLAERQGRPRDWTWQEAGHAQPTGTV